MKLKNLLILFMFFVIFIASLNKVLGVDLGFHLKSGEYIFKNKVITSFDIFSYTFYDKPLLNHQWLSQLIFYIFYKINPNFLVLLKIIIIIVSFLFVFKTSFLLSKHLFFSIIITILSCFAAKTYFDIRPQIFTYLFLIIFIYIISLYKDKNKNYLFLLPILIIFWANLHAGFISGVFILLIYFFCELIRSKLNSAEIILNNKKLFNLSLTAVIVLLFSLINPYGYKLLLYPFQLQTKSTIFSYTLLEWLPAKFSPETRIYFLMLIFSSVVLLFSLRRLVLTDVALFFIFTFLSFLQERHIVLFAIIVGPILTKYISQFSFSSFLLKPLENKSILNSFCAILIIIYGLNLFSEINLENQIKENLLPKDSIEFLRLNKIPNNLFNEYSFGGYIIWKLYPKYKVFIDGRGDTLYSDEFYKDYLKISNLKENYEDVLKKYNINSILIANYRPLAKGFLKRKDWHKVYEDYFSKIFIKNLPKEKLVYPKGSYYYFQKGNFYFQKGKYELALSEYNKANKLNPDISLVHNNIGSCLAKLGRIEEAKIEFQKAIELGPTSQARKNLNLLENLK